MIDNTWYILKWNELSETQQLAVICKGMPIITRSYSIWRRVYTLRYIPIWSWFIPSDTRRNVIITSKRRRNVMLTLLLRHASNGIRRINTVACGRSKFLHHPPVQRGVVDFQIICVHPGCVEPLGVRIRTTAATLDLHPVHDSFNDDVILQGFC